MWYSDGGPPIRSAVERDVPGATGPLRARLYSPNDPGGPHPLLVFFHGGGFVTGDLDTHDDACRTLCHDAGVNVLAVDYRLAPEHPFPAAVEDAFSVFRWAAAHAAELDADPTRVGVAGDSAGGNLSTVVAQLASRDGGATPFLQVLIYPTTDMRRGQPSRSLFARGFFLESEDMDWYEDNYLGGAPEKRLDPRASPILGGDLGSVCPAIVVTAGFDPLRDEGNEYAAALSRAGVPTRLVSFDGLIHGFINMGAVSPVARNALGAVGRAVREASATGRP
jgi:acetyl esterase